MDDPINFTYSDTDSYQNEISELYSYGEESDFFANRNAFEESMEDCGLPLTWKHMVNEQKLRAINYLMTTLEVSCRIIRLKSCRALAYLIQGNFGECLSLEEQASNSKENVFSLLEHGIFQAFVQQLLIEASLSSNEIPQQQSSQNFVDSSELRLILSVLCTIIETLYHAKESTDLKTLEIRQQFISELQCPIGDELLSVTLFQMLNNFCGGLAPHYPVRKITLLLWKVILITLGGTNTMKEMKENSRKSANLEPLLDDTIEVTKNMRPCSPPLMPDGQIRNRSALSGGFVSRESKRRVFKQPAFDDAVYAYAKDCLLSPIPGLKQPVVEDLENDTTDYSKEFFDSGLNDSAELAQENQNSYKRIDKLNHLESGEDSFNKDTVESEGYSSDRVDTDLDDPANFENNQDTLQDMNLEDIESVPPVSSNLKPLEVDAQLDSSRSDVTTIYKGLPWAPKVRKSDLSQHLSYLRQKFLGYVLPNDLETTFGLPDPIIEGVNVMRKHLYTTLAEVQLEREELMEKYPLTYKELNPDYEDTPIEKLYNALLPRLPQYMIALLKILLAASTNTKSRSERTESINIMSETNADCESSTIIRTMKMNADSNRHKEIIIKAVSAILILLLKHSKVNHIYQFEYISQQLMFANCIPLILKFLSQDIYSYIVTSKSTISAIDFPACVIGEQPELTTEAIELCSFQPYCWRNMFSCINLVKILNKLIKWKHSRIMMLVVFKSAPTLSKALSVRHAMFQLYILKLLKVQLKFLGRQWKKSNMKLISAIYQKVRHRLTDDWAYSNDNEARPWDFQAEEFTLQANINKFHQRRYQDLLAPTNKSKSSIVFNQSAKLGGFDDIIDEDYDFGNQDIALISPNFERNYEKWLESEVFQRRIDWDRLIYE